MVNRYALGLDQEGHTFVGALEGLDVQIVDIDGLAGTDLGDVEAVGAHADVVGQDVFHSIGFCQIEDHGVEMIVVPVAGKDIEGLSPVEGGKRARVIIEKQGLAGQLDGKAAVLNVGDFHALSLQIKKVSL